MTRGVLYITWGTGMEAMLDRSVKSLRQYHPDTQAHFVSLPADSTMLAKNDMWGMSPFDTTLYLDADTVVLGDLTFGFDQAERHGLACCINEAPWARRYPSLEGDDIEYNCGVLFFAKQAESLFQEYQNNVNIDSSCEFYAGDGKYLTCPCNDQAGFAKAVRDLRFNPFVLPMNWNYRPKFQKSFMGPVRIWHDYEPVPQMILDWNKGQAGRHINMAAVA